MQNRISIANYSFLHLTSILSHDAHVINVVVVAVYRSSMNSNVSLKATRELLLLKSLLFFYINVHYRC